MWCHRLRFSYLISFTVSSITHCRYISASKQMLILFEFRKTQVGAEELHKVTMHCGVSFCQEEICHKDLCTYWQGLPTSYCYFFYLLWKKIQYTIFFPVFLFYFKEKISLKYNNVIIKTWVLLFFSLHWQLNF